MSDENKPSTDGTDASDVVAAVAGKDVSAAGAESSQSPNFISAIGEKLGRQFSSVDDVQKFVSGAQQAVEVERARANRVEAELRNLKTSPPTPQARVEELPEVPQNDVERLRTQLKAELNETFQRRDFLAKFPEATDVADMVFTEAKIQGKDPLGFYEATLKPAIDAKIASDKAAESETETGGSGPSRISADVSQKVDQLVAQRKEIPDGQGSDAIDAAIVQAALGPEFFEGLTGKR